MIKKILMIIGILIILLVGTLFAAPYLFKDQIKAKIAKAINDKVDAKVTFADADLSLFKNFPNANVTVEKLLIINKAPFEGAPFTCSIRVDENYCGKIQKSDHRNTSRIRNSPYKQQGERGTF